VGLSAQTISLFALCGAAIQLIAISVIAYRMGYRGKWLFLPLILTIALNVFQHFGAYSVAEQGGVEFDRIDFLVRSLASSAAESIGIMQIILAIRGHRKNTSTSTESVNA